MDGLSAVTRDVEATRDVGAAVAGLLRGGDVVVLAGDLGAGKTALAQGIGRGLGVEEPVLSPTFVIVREYEGRVPLAHVDVYRLDHFQELHELGFEEILDADRVTVVEWGDRVSPLLPEDRLEVRIEFGTDDTERRIDCQALGRSWTARRQALQDALDRALGRTEGP